MVDVEALSSSDPRIAAKGKGYFWLAMALCGGVVLLHAGWLASALQLAAALCVGFVFFLYSSQSRMLYAPCPGSRAACALAAAPAAAALTRTPLPDPRLPRKTSANPHPYDSPRHHAIQFEDVRIRAADGVNLHGWWMTQAAAPVRSTAPTLVFFHGNAGNIGHRVPNFYALYTHTRCNILAIDYRGYGESGDPPGAIDEQGLQLDAEAAWAWVKARAEIDQSKVFLFGRSLGGAVAIALAADLLARRAPQLPAGLILENTFTSVADMARNLFPPLALGGPLVERLIHNKWPSVDRVRRSPPLPLSTRHFLLRPTSNPSSPAPVAAAFRFGTSSSPSSSCQVPATSWCRRTSSLALWLRARRC